MPIDAAEFRRQLLELRGMIADGVACHAAWKALTVETDSEAGALNRYRGLFKSALASMQRVAFLQFSKVFDKNPKAISIVNLHEVALRNPDLTPCSSPHELEEIGQAIEKNKITLKALKQLRDQRIAHQDIVLSQHTQLRFGDLDDLSKAVVDIYNKLQHGHDKSQTSFDQIAKEATRHTLGVIRIMQEERDRDQRKIKEADEVYLRSTAPSSNELGLDEHG